MITRTGIIEEAVVKCIKDLYTFVQPSVKWDEFQKENEVYSNKYRNWENYNKAFTNKESNPNLWEQYKVTFPNWENKSQIDCIGPKPFEFYYLPEDIVKDICDLYIHAYELDSQQELLDIIEILKSYCKEPIINKWVERSGNEPGYRGYEYPDNLEKELYQILKEYFDDSETDPNVVAKELQDKFFEFLDMAGNFFRWDRDLQSFNTSIYLGPCPNFNKQAVIENWKKYKNQNIEINEEQIRKEYYGDDE